MVGRNFNIAALLTSRPEGRIPSRNPTLKMTSTKINFSFNRIARLTDLSDLAEMLFPGNRNQQHAFLTIWISLRWADHHIVPNLGVVSREQGLSRRTFERVRAKMRRMGLIDHVSRFKAQYGYREGWVLSSRLETGLKQLCHKVAGLKGSVVGSKDKDELTLQLAVARRDVTGREDEDGTEGEMI